MSERGVFVYVIRSASGHLKVGTAKNVSKRLRALQGANSQILTLEHVSGGMLRVIAEQVEFEAHHRLHQFHVHGEWFSCTVEEARQAIATAAVYVRNKRSAYQSHTKVCRNLRTAKPYSGSRRWLS